MTKIYTDQDTGDEMPVGSIFRYYEVGVIGIGVQVWLPPTPPSDDVDECCVDTVVEMKYDTKSNISPAVLASVASFRFSLIFFCL